MSKTKFDLNSKLNEWHEAEKQLNHWKQRENELRKEIFEASFPTPIRGKKNKTRIDHGMALIGDYRQNYKVDRALLTATMSDVENNGNVLPLIHEVISFDPRVSESKFEALSDDDKKLLGDLLTVTPGTPGLEIKPANKVRW